MNMTGHVKYGADVPEMSIMVKVGNYNVILDT